MHTTGSSDTRLIILRGNSASGKTTAAWRIRELFGHGIAIVSQDVIRRDILKQGDDPGNPAIGLIDLTARYALDFGFHVIVEGILFSDTYGPMLQRLAADHAGSTHAFYWDVPFDETVMRHTSKPQAAEYGAELMSGWYRERDLIPALDEHVFNKETSLEEAVGTIMSNANLH